MLTKNEKAQDKVEDDKEKHAKKFLVPSKGGVLQNMNKDEDGNIKLELTKKIKVSDDTFIFRFGFDKETDIFGLPIGGHVIFSADINKELCCRKYTPISEVTRQGYIDFLIKVYRAGLHPRFPDGGMMSQYIDRMAIGDSMLMEGPKGRLAY